jgi:hypothetical protein
MPGPNIIISISSLSMSEDAKQVWFDIVGKAVDKLDVNAAPVAMAIFKHCLQVVENNQAGEEARWLGILTRCMNAMDRCRLLRHVLSDSWVKNRIREGCAHCRHLASIRVAQLNSPEPTFSSWCMPKASMPSHPDVERFLRGPDQSYTVRGLNGISHARNFAAKYCNGNVKDGYSLRSTNVGGTGQNAYVTMLKTKTAFEKSMEKFKEEQSEKKMLLTLLNLPGLDAENDVAAPDDLRNVRQRCDGGEIIDLCMDD